MFNNCCQDCLIAVYCSLSQLTIVVFTFRMGGRPSFEVISKVGGRSSFEVISKVGWSSSFEVISMVGRRPSLDLISKVGNRQVQGGP